MGTKTHQMGPKVVAVGFEPTKVSQYLLRVPRLTAPVRYRNFSVSLTGNKGNEIQFFS
uniref:Uncharacterized protein n=1 Tax=viral metagenome TaxID=1070528 RepID=A0A6C0BKM7_9ZZZZ